MIVLALMKFTSSDFTNFINDQTAENLLVDLQKLGSQKLKLNRYATASGLFNDDSLEFSISATQADHYRASLFYQEYSNPCPCSGEESALIDGYCTFFIEFKPDSLQVEIIFDDE